MIRFLLLIFLLTACSGPGVKQFKPLNGTHADTSGAALRTKIQTYLADQNGPANAQYDFARIDLNGDGARDALVLFRLPYTYWCGAGGCTMAVFEARGDEFILRSEIQNVRGPVMVSPQKTAGWRDIVLRLSGVNMPDRNVVLQFSRGAYPVNPVTAPTYPGRLNDIVGDRLFP